MSQYIVSKTDGTPVDPNAKYFVLRLDTDIHARKAAVAYAGSIQSENPALARAICLEVIKASYKQIVKTSDSQDKTSR